MCGEATNYPALNSECRKGWGMEEMMVVRGAEAAGAEEKGRYGAANETRRREPPEGGQADGGTAHRLHSWNTREKSRQRRGPGGGSFRPV